MYKTFEVILE